MLLRSLVLFLFILTAAAQNTPITGTAVPGMAAFDQFMTAHMTKWGVPGGQLAVSKDGRLVFARGYGFADTGTSQQVQPTSLFRIASISKPITSAAILKLVEENRLSLDDKVFSIVTGLTGPAGTTPDARLANITVRQALQHAAGWDSALSFDPMFRAVTAANAVGAPAPGTCETIIRYMLGQPLNFDPGARYSYSNFGYCVLGRVIERITGTSYENYVRTNVLLPMGITDMKLGKTSVANRAANEVTYYGYPGQPTVASIVPPFNVQVPWPYGGFHLEAMDAHGGWIATATDLVRFANAEDGQGTKAFLKPATMAQMLAKPSFASANATQWYGFGWLWRNSSSRKDWLHDGSLDGTMTLLIRHQDGYTMAALFNTRPASDQWNAFFGDMDNGLYAAMRASTPPETDIFPQFGINETFPVINPGQVIHGSNFVTGITAGSWVAIKGVRLARTTRIWVESDFVGGRLPEVLDGVRVKINGKSAFVYYISPSQINVQAPDDLTAGPVTVETSLDGVPSTAGVAELRSEAPGFFTYPSGTRTHIVAVHLDSTVAGEPAAVPGTRPAQEGKDLILFGTGFERTPAGVYINAPIPLSTPVEVRVNGILATVKFAGLVSPGLFQLNIEIPPGVLTVGTNSGYYPITARFRGVDSLATTVVFVAR